MSDRKEGIDDPDRTIELIMIEIFGVKDLGTKPFCRGQQGCIIIRDAIAARQKDSNTNNIGVHRNKWKC